MNFTKCCTSCKLQLPMDRFQVRPRKLKGGGVAMYTLHQCRKCVNSRDTAGKQRKRVKREPVARQFLLPPAPVPVLAVRIANRAEESRIAVFRSRGRLAWCDARRTIPSGADVLGYYDHGADVRAIRADLAA